VNLARLSAVAVMSGAVACGGGSDPVMNQGGGVTLVQVQSQVLTPHCALSGCHVGGAGAPFGLDMSSVSASSASLIGVASSEIPGMFRVDAGDAASSYMYWKLSGNPNILGDPMPASGGPLSASDLALIASWIDGGAK
jgi:hypothetical protein